MPRPWQSDSDCSGKITYSAVNVDLYSPTNDGVRKKRYIKMRSNTNEQTPAKYSGHYHFLARIALLLRCGLLLQTDLSVDLSVTIVSLAKTAKPLAMPDSGGPN